MPEVGGDANALIGLIEELGEQEIQVSLARVRDGVRARMRSDGVEKAVGASRIHDTLSHGVMAFTEQGAQSA